MNKHCSIHQHNSFMENYIIQYYFCAASEHAIQTSILLNLITSHCECDCPLNNSFVLYKVSHAKVIPSLLRAVAVRRRDDRSALVMMT